jgi:hypothetical protein
MNEGPVNNKFPLVAASYHLKTTPDGAVGVKVAVSFIHIFSPLTVGLSGIGKTITSTEVLVLTPSEF